MFWPLREFAAVFFCRYQIKKRQNHRNQSIDFFRLAVRSPVAPYARKINIVKTNPVFLCLVQHAISRFTRSVRYRLEKTPCHPTPFRWMSLMSILIYLAACQPNNLAMAFGIRRPEVEWAGIESCSINSTWPLLFASQHNDTCITLTSTSSWNQIARNWRMHNRYICCNPNNTKRE